MSYDFVIITDHGFVNGGLANIAVNQAIGLARKELRVLFLSGTERVSPDLLASGVTVKIIGDGEFFDAKNEPARMLAGLFSVRVYKSILKIFKGDDLAGARVLVHGWTKCLSPSIFFALRKFDVNVYVWNHDYFLMCPNGGLFNYPARRACVLSPGSVRCLISNCDSRSYIIKIYRYARHMILKLSGYERCVMGFVTIGSRNRSLVSKYLPHDKIIRIDNFIDIPAQDAQFCPERDGSVVVIGRPSPEKGLAELFEQLGEIGFKRTIVVVGAQRSDYAQMDLSGLNVVFTGWVAQAEVGMLLAKAEYLIFPSLWHEGSPLVVQEAFGYGVPVVCATTNAGADLVESYEAGVLYDPYSVESLRRAIDELEAPGVLKEKSKSARENFHRLCPTMEKHLTRLHEMSGMQG